METILTSYEGLLAVTLTKYKKGEIPAVKSGLTVLRIGRGTGQLTLWIANPDEARDLEALVQEAVTFLEAEAQEAP